MTARTRDGDALPLAHCGDPRCGGWLEFSRGGDGRWQCACNRCLDERQQIGSGETPVLALADLAETYHGCDPRELTHDGERHV